MPQGKRGKFTIPGHETARNRHMANSSLIIFFKYMTFVEHIFNSYQGGPYSPTVHITPNSPTQCWDQDSSGSG